MPRAIRVSRFPALIRNEIEERLLSLRFDSYRTLAAELEKRTWYISKSALQRHHQRLKAQKIQENKQQ